MFEITWLVKGIIYYHLNGMQMRLRSHVCNSGLPHGFPYVSKSEFPNYMSSHEKEPSTLVSQGF